MNDPNFAMGAFGVLMVEKGFVDVAAVRKLLRDAGITHFDLIQAASVPEAIAVLAERDVDAVLLGGSSDPVQQIPAFISLQAASPDISVIISGDLTQAAIPIASGPPALHDISRNLRLCLQRALRRRFNERALVHLATHDQLTGLANRILLEDRLNQALARSRRTGRGGAILFIDIDRFKHVNDSHGHEFGDRVLATIAHRLAGRLRATDTLARFGGDEFVVIVEGVTSEFAAEFVIGKIRAAIEEPIRNDARTMHLTASVGVAFYPGHGQTISGLLRHADAAMYGAKRGGGGRHGFAEALAATGSD